MKIFKNKELTEKKIKLSDEMQSQIFSLNKKFPQLKEVTEKYFDDDTEIDFKSIEKAFVSENDDSMLMEKHKKFVKDYIKTIGIISNKYGVADYSKKKTQNYFEMKSAEETIDETIFKIENTLNNLAKLYLTQEKKEILNLIVESQEKHIDESTRQKKIAEAERKWDDLKATLDSNQFILPPSLGKDLKSLEKLYYSLQEKRKINNKTFKITAISVSSIIIILIGIAIWVTII